MADREKVIKAIEICYFGNHSCTECDRFYEEDCNDKLIRDALELLKGQETKTGKWLPCKASIYPYGYDVKCSECGLQMGSTFGYHFCPKCGAKMDLEGW